MSLPLIHYFTYGEPHLPPLLILHGFLGSARNWATIASHLEKDFYVITVDLRNHGSSFHNDSHTYSDMANDILALLKNLNIEKINILGHSMGGKVAMKFACLYPETVISLVVVDIAPKQYYPHREEVRAMLELDLSKIERRMQAEELLSSSIPDFGLRKFLLTNLAVDENGKYFWRVNLEVFNRDINVLGSNPLKAAEQFEGKTLFITGGKSDFVKRENYPLIYKYFPNAQIESLENSDHNPHFTAREDFLVILRNFLFEHF